MTNASDTMSDDYEEYDEFDDDDERGLSGFSVLVIGLVMIGAFISVVWIAYTQGIRTGADGLAGGTPYVVADPEPIKIASADDSAPADDREVYDVFDGESETPVTVLAEGPEEPVARDAEDTIGSIASATEDAGEAANDEVESGSTSLSLDDAVSLSLGTEETEPEPVVVTPPTEVSTIEVNDPPAAALGARSGTHVVQIGAFRSSAEAQAQWNRLQTRLGDFLSGKSDDIERADLGDRGVYHRLRIGPFSSYDTATAFCADLKTRGQDCLIKKL